MKYFSEEDIEKNIEGFSDTKLKKFILTHGLNYRGSSYGLNNAEIKNILIEFNKLVTKSMSELIEFITFVDLLERNSNVFKFATMCHLSSYVHPNETTAKYSEMVTKLFGYDDIVRTMMEGETARLKDLFKCDSIRIETIEERENRIKKTKRQNEIGVHKSHCCFIHGCKYGDDDCPVEKAEIKQQYICEQCQDDGIKSIDELEAMLILGLKKCSECGHYYRADDFPVKN